MSGGSMLIENLRRNAESMARGINPPASGSDPMHYLDGMAAARIEALEGALRDLVRDCSDDEADWPALKRAIELLKE